nr:hypothetical protein Itr_chr07CG06230 [Ipomoea trifida]
MDSPSSSITPPIPWYLLKVMPSKKQSVALETGISSSEKSSRVSKAVSYESRAEQSFEEINNPNIGNDVRRSLRALSSTAR